MWIHTLLYRFITETDGNYFKRFCFTNGKILGGQVACEQIPFGG